MSVSPKKTLAGLLCALLLAAPAPAAAKVSVTIEVAYGGVIGCGLAFFVYFGGTWESGLAGRGLQSALIEVGDGPAHLGVPIPSLVLLDDAAAAPAGHRRVQLDLLRWRF
jgi:hypothetical protein